MAQLSAAPFGPAELAQALLQAVRQARLDQVPDSLLGGQPLRHFPSLDLAVVAFPEGRAPVWANVLFSREHPQGVVADIPPDAGAVRNIRYLADQTDAQGRSAAWLPDADWSAMRWQPLWGGGPVSVVAPYPASLVKLMVAVGVALAVDTGPARWAQDWAHGGATRSVAAWTESMLVASSNEATSAMVALLHQAGVLRTGAGAQDPLHQLFARWGLPTLRLADTRADGGWRNADGAGVGHLQMTAWDTVRLLWLLRGHDAGAPPWLAGGPPGGVPSPLSDASRAFLWQCLDDQGLHTVLSSTALAGVPGWCAGIPARLPERWVTAEGGVQVEDYRYPPDVRAANAASTVHFAHKTGNTENYVSDAGWVQAPQPGGRRYLVAFLSNLGQRYASNPACATHWRVPALGAAVDAWLRAHWG